MSAPLGQDIADRLAKLLGMLGSAHAGERAVAAAKADELLREHGLTWRDVVLPKHGEHASTKEKIDFVLAHLDAISEWERGFVHTVSKYRVKELSAKQLEVLDNLVRKARLKGGAP